ncbi:MAG: ribonucleoside-diphosphate reductase subunit alpha [Simkaniaceae bacterium]|nr:ribonucleoside-diphosphate reductase subunit alpha [Simkaniaceae bacterium]
MGSFVSENVCAVIKRDGTIVPFRHERIKRAIEAAVRDTKKVPLPAPLGEELEELVDGISSRVKEQTLEMAGKNISLTVEGIQDLVEVTLMKNGEHEIARDYIIYRDHHKNLREEDPRNLKVYRKPDDGRPIRFNPMKISASLEKTFVLANGIPSHGVHDFIDIVNLLTKRVVERATSASKRGKSLHIHTIQDFMEEELMGAKCFREAKHYILRRAAEGEFTHPPLPPSTTTRKAKVRVAKKNERLFKAVNEKGKEVAITETQLLERLDGACLRFDTIISPEELLERTALNFYEGMTVGEVDTALIMAARAGIEEDPAYATIAARLLLDTIYREVAGLSVRDPRFTERHADYFREYVDYGVRIGRLAPEMKGYDLKALAGVLRPERDDLFRYLGLQTLYDRYFIHDRERRLETPQIFWMRVAMGLAVREKNKMEYAIEFYDVLSQLLYLSATPTLFNSGTTHPQLSSCYLSTVFDDLGHIFETIADDAQLSKWAGGLGNDWTNVRGTGARIKGTNGTSQGIIPFLKVANDTAVAVNQGGKRKGALCSYLETWHIDVEDFLELRKNTGDERRRTHDTNTANWIPDLFMKRVRDEGKWTLFSPDEVPDLHDLYGVAFEKRYVAYEAQAAEGKLTIHKKVDAVWLWRKMLSMLFETGHPWLTFKDPCNIRSPQDHVGVVHSSNLCTEVTLNTSKEETAVCNLGSVNLVAHIAGGGIDEDKLAKTIRTAMRMLDNVIDINFYPIEKTRKANLSHRAVGLGMMGFQDALNLLNISYASHEAVAFADKSTEMIAYYAILYSSELAKERNPYPSYKGSKWERGLLPIDTVALLARERGEGVHMDSTTSMDWNKVRRRIRKHGMRNSYTLAIAPTATIANIAGVSPSIEPNYKNLYVKSNLSGEFTVLNPRLVETLKALNLWDKEMVEDLKYFDGSLQEIERIPDEVKRQFFTAFEIDPEWIIECAAKRQKWLDQAQSLNLYLSEPNGKKLHGMYMSAWEKGLKTTYYLRTSAATRIEKSTIDVNKRGLQPRWMKEKSPSGRLTVTREEVPEKREGALPPVPPMSASCNLDESCEACQ